MAVKKRSADHRSDHEPDDLARGTFRADGSWDPWSQFRTDEYRYVNHLVAMRRRHEHTPGELADFIAAGPHPKMFVTATLDQWRALDAAARGNRDLALRSWRSAHSQTSAERTVVVAGYGTLYYWRRDGKIAPGKDSPLQRPQTVARYEEPEEPEQDNDVVPLEGGRP